MIEMDNEKRQKAVLQVEAERDKTVRGSLSAENATVRSDRKTLALEGWNAQYEVEYRERRFSVKDVATILLKDLAASIRKQLMISD